MGYGKTDGKYRTIVLQIHRDYKLLSNQGCGINFRKGGKIGKRPSRRRQA
jgi:hypothetical protein